jgi:hypothetical protein
VNNFNKIKPLSDRIDSLLLDIKDSRPTAAQCKTPGKGTKWGKTK